MRSTVTLSQYSCYSFQSKVFSCNYMRNSLIALISQLCLAVLFPAVLYASPIQDTNEGMQALQSGDTVGAMRLFRKAAEQGYAPAQAQLAIILDRSENNEEAFAWYQKAADQNDAEGQYGLGMMYLAGDGIEKDETQGIQLIEAAAQQNLTRAMISIFHFYEKGLHGLPADTQQAVNWLERIAATDNKWAAELLASAYRNGELGVTPNDEKALFWESKLQNSAR